MTDDTPAAAQSKPSDDDRGPSAAADDLSRPLKLVTAVRCGMITLLLGTGLAVNLNDAASFQNPAYQTLTGTIVLTYAATVAFGLWLRWGQRLTGMMVAGFVFDGLLATALVLLTGRFSSPFTYLFVIVGLYGGTMAGPRAGIQAALSATIGVVVVACFELGLFSSPLVASARESSAPIFRAAILVGATFSVGLLSGLLQARLESTSQELAESERDIATLQSIHERVLNSLRSGVLTVDSDDTITYANPAATRLLRTEPDGLIGRRLPTMNLDAPVGDERWETDFVSPDGDVITLGLSSTSLSMERGERGQVVTFQDLTELRLAERQLAHQERLATVGRFAASIAHEIRNPLAAISGAVEMLEIDLAEMPETVPLTRVIGAEIDRLNDLVKEVLDYAGPRQVVRRRIDVVEIIQRTGELFESDPLVSGTDFEIMGSSEALVRADADLMRQILLNLWRNAAEAMREHEIAAPQIVTRISEAEGYVDIFVEDTGPGIPAEVRDAIFEPFFTTRDEGTGLGLATAFQLVEQLDGRIELLMEHDERRTLGGAAFLIRLMGTSSRESNRAVSVERDHV